ncbi:MAG: hypothetical protein D6714_04050 [Bacteroidetes bacterium]|nr:MAG: hypothetical protein D6714_04050 [Bacteroidota bacterium]
MAIWGFGGKKFRALFLGGRLRGRSSFGCRAPVSLKKRSVCAQTGMIWPFPTDNFCAKPRPGKSKSGKPEERAQNKSDHSFFPKKKMCPGRPPGHIFNFGWK